VILAKKEHIAAALDGHVDLQRAADLERVPAAWMPCNYHEAQAQAAPPATWQLSPITHVAPRHHHLLSRRSPGRGPVSVRAHACLPETHVEWPGAKAHDPAAPDEIVALRAQ
jgi:hypothetical protein